MFSFVAASQVENFSGDIKDFIDYLVSNQGLSDSQYLISVGAGKLMEITSLNLYADSRTLAGTEPFTGSNADFVVSGYSIAIE